MKRTALAVALLLAVAACGGDDGSTTTVHSSTAATETTVATTTGGGSGDTTSTTVSALPTGSALADALGLEPMEVLTPVAGGGDRPDFAWTPVDGATFYRITLLAPDGSFYWGWEGEESFVPLGGFPRLVPAATGPRLVTGMSWTVMAFDSERRPLAAGGSHSISP